MFFFAELTSEIVDGAHTYIFGREFRISIMYSQFGQILQSRLTEAASADRQLFREQSGFAIVCRVLLLANEVSDKVPSVIPNKSVIYCQDRKIVIACLV